MTDLDGRVAVVTGASTGIGNATARALADEGARVVLAARSADLLDELADDIASAGGDALAVPTDVTARDEVEALVDRAVAEYGGVDVLVNNAGIGDWENEGVPEADVERWRAEVDVNLVGTMLVTRYATAAMADGGDVVNVSSGADRIFSGEWPAYVASKWGVRGFTGSAFLDLRERGIRTTLLSPGEVDTPIQPDGFADERLAADVKILDPEDVAAAVVFAVTQPPHACVSTLYLTTSGRGPTAE